MPKKREFVKKLRQEERVETRDMKIIFDGKQYNIRIPRDFAETINETIGKIEEMKFKLKLKTPSVDSKEKPKLTGELIYD